MKRFPVILLLIFSSITARAELTVFAAASMTDVMKALAAQHAEATDESIRFNFASSGTLARQIDAGAPADLFVSANVEWMDYLSDRGLLQDGTRINIALNRLVLIAPMDSPLTFEGFPANLTGRLAVGDFKSAPAGTYAETALISLGWLDDVEDRLVKGTNVRTVLMYVERGEVDAGIVYATDALRSHKVKVIGTFPAKTHAPIVYPAAAASENESARAFLSFLKTEEAKAILKQYGFTCPE